MNASKNPISRYKMAKNSLTGSSSDRRKGARQWVENVRKMVMEDTECGNGTYWCNHLYDPAHPWVWVDFRFLSIKHPKLRYFSAAMTTLEYMQYSADEEIIRNMAEEKLGPYVGPDPFEDFLTKKSNSLNRLSRPPEYVKYYEDVRLFENDNRSAIMSVPRKVKPSIKVEFYRPGCYGVHPSLNTPYIDDGVIMKFIEQFRDLGEPTQEGIVWEGEEVMVVPERLNTRG